MNLDNKIVFAHKGYFNRESHSFYKESSVELYSISTQKEYIGILDADVRKSKDGVLYCYHGTFWEHFFTLKFPKNFSVIKEKYGVNTLAEVLEVITEDKSICIEIKDQSITREDLINAFQGKKFKQVLIAHMSASFLRRFSDMPAEFVKFLITNPFCNFYDMQKLKKDGFKYIEVMFLFQATKSLIKKVEDNGMIFSLPGLFFIKPKSYWRTIEKYPIRIVSSDFI